MKYSRRSIIAYIRVPVNEAEKYVEVVMDAHCRSNEHLLGLCNPIGLEECDDNRFSLYLLHQWRKLGYMPLARFRSGRGTPALTVRENRNMPPMNRNSWLFRTTPAKRKAMLQQTLGYAAALRGRPRPPER